ncbi:hypothetical protein ABH925_000159 [Streptacidiphilus sp. EB129]
MGSARRTAACPCPVARDSLCTAVETDGRVRALVRPHGHPLGVDAARQGARGRDRAGGEPP